MEQTESSETSTRKIQTPGNQPKERIQHSEQDESLKSRNSNVFSFHKSHKPNIYIYIYIYIYIFQMCWYNIVKKKCRIALFSASLEITEMWAKAIQPAQAETLSMIEGERWGTKPYTTWAGELCNMNVQSACVKRNNCTNALYHH